MLPASSPRVPPPAAPSGRGCTSGPGLAGEAGWPGRARREGEHARYSLDLWSFFLNLFHSYISEPPLLRSDLALCGTFSYPLFSEEREENFRDLSKVKQPIVPLIFSQTLFREMSEKHKNTRSPGIYVLAGEADS